MYAQWCMRCNIFVSTHLSLYAKDTWKIHNNRTEHELVPFRRNSIWLGCCDDFFLGNIFHSFANGRAINKASTKDISLLILPSTSTRFWFGFSSSLDYVHCYFVVFELKMSYPVAGHEGVVSVDTYLFSRDLGAMSAYKVPYLMIKYSDEQIVENITLPLLFLGRRWSHCIRLMSTILR